MSVTVFTIDSSEIEGRLDPYYYLPEFRELEEKLETFKISSLLNPKSFLFHFLQFYRFREIYSETSLFSSEEFKIVYFAKDKITKIELQFSI
jgi:hypothetical protein